MGFVKAHKYRSTTIGLFRFWLIVFNTLMLFIQCSVDNQSNLNVFRYNESTSVSTLDPAFVKSQSENWIVTQLNAGLVQLDTLLNIKPMVADSWTTNAAGTSYIFHLRKDVFFHPWENNESRRLTAFDVKYSFERLMDSATASPGTWIFSDKVDLNNAFQVLDSFRFQLNLLKPFPPLLGMLSMPYCYLLPKEAVQHYGKDFRNHPVGCGPFKFKRWEEQVGMVLQKFEGYFESDINGKHLPYLKAINIDLNPNKSSAFMDFSAGKYDFFNEIEAGVKDELIDPYGNLTPKYESRYQLKKAPFLNTEFLMFNMQSANPIIQNENIRKAINYGINRNSIVNNVRNGLGIVAEEGFTPPSLLNKKTHGFSYDPQKALELITLSGIDISTPINLGITSDYLDMALYIKQDLERLGFKIKIDVYPSSYLRQLRNEQQIDFFRGSWIADYPDAENYLACFYSNNFYPNGPNYSRYSNLAYDRLYENAMKQTEVIERQKLLSQMDSLLLKNPPFVALYYDKSLRITTHNIIDLWSYPNNMLQLKYVKMVN